MDAPSSGACLESKGMKERIQIGRTNKTRKKSSSNDNPSKRPKLIVRVKSKAPAACSPEIPILHVLSRAPDAGVSTKLVLQEVSSAKWFDKLSADDRNARYSGSKRKIVDSVIKFARKNLVIKGEIFPAGDGGKPIGVWRITQNGMDKAEYLGGRWTPKYSDHDDVIIEERKK